MRDALRKDRAEYDVYANLLIGFEDLRQQLLTRKRLTEEARAVFQQVAVQTQTGIQAHLEGLVSAALSAVFEDPYEFRAIFELKRNKAECRLVFSDGEEEYDPMSSSGGGPIDVAAFALKLAIHGLLRNRPVLLLDEPMKFVSRDRVPFAADLVRALNRKLGIQIILVTHIPEFEKIADAIIYIKNGEVQSPEEEA